jgi:hypothetical protein
MNSMSHSCFTYLRIGAAILLGLLSPPLTEAQVRTVAPQMESRYPLEEVLKQEFIPSPASPLMQQPRIAQQPNRVWPSEPPATQLVPTLPMPRPKSLEPLPPVEPEPLPPVPAHLTPAVTSELPVAETPAVGESWFCDDFGADPIQHDLPYDAESEREPYETKTAVVGQRPWIEWGRRFYGDGPFQPSQTWLGRTNLVAPQFLLYGDYRAALATRKSNGIENNQLANRLNLEADLKITSTGRFHTALQPLNRGQQFTRVEFDSQEADFIDGFNANPVTGYLEADLGAFWGGLTGKVLPFEMPIAVGAMPLLFQNGVWLDDNVIGVAATLPAKNSALLDIPNYDITFFYLFDNITSPAFPGDNNVAKGYGAAAFLEAYEGYIELDYGYLEDRSNLDRSYHNVGLSYTRRYGSWLSNSVRLISNLGQDPQGIGNTADGLIVLVENSLVTSDPYLFVPYFNFFAGFRQPQSFARNAAAGGILRNTGILFESDNLTGYPTLDASGNEAYGGALGVNLIPGTINQQFVLEYAFVQVMDDVAFRKAAGNQHGIGARYQRNLSYNWLFRADAMVGFLDNAEDISGARMEWRYKF